MANPPTQPLFTAVQLGQLLRDARKQRGLTQAALGARLALSQNRISHLESHADELSVRQLLTWCAVVGLELHAGERPTQPGPGASINAGPVKQGQGSTPAAEW